MNTWIQTPEGYLNAVINQFQEFHQATQNQIAPLIESTGPANELYSKIVLRDNDENRLRGLFQKMRLDLESCECAQAFYENAIHQAEVLKNIAVLDSNALSQAPEWEQKIGCAKLLNSIFTAQLDDVRHLLSLVSAKLPKN